MTLATMMFGNLPLALFVTPWLIGLGAALASIPIIIHLLSRRRPRKLRWPAMQWLLAAMKRHQRRLQMENWLILLLRVAALILLGLALARPIITDPNIAGLLEGRRTVFLVVDTSYSTESKADARTVFERIKQQADLVLENMGNEDALAVIATNDPREDVSSGTSPYVLLPRNVGDEAVARAKEEIARRSPRHAPARWTEVIETIQEQMEPEDVNRHVVVITDLQAKDWLATERVTLPGEVGPTSPASPRDASSRLQNQLMSLLRMPTRVQIVDVGGTDRRNLAIRSVTNLTERGAFVGKALTLEVEVANYGSKPVRGALVEVKVGDRPGVQRQVVQELQGANMGLRVPKPTIEKVRIDLPRTVFEEGGSHWLRVRVVPPGGDPTADSLGLDSERFLALRVRRRIQVVSWTNRSLKAQLDPRRYLEGIYSAEVATESGGSSLFEYRGLSREDELLDRLRRRDREPVDLVVLANAVPRDPQLGRLLRSYVREGGALMVFSGENLKDGLTFNEVFHQLSDADVEGRPFCPYPVAAAEILDPAKLDSPFRLDLRKQQTPHPVVAPFVSVGAEDWIQRVPPLVWGRTAFVTTTANGAGAPSESVPEDAAQVLLRYEARGEDRDGAPAAIVAGRYGEGRTLWFSSSLDRGWLERAEFLFLPIFMDEAALWLTQRPRSGRTVDIGGRIVSRLPLGATRPRFAIPLGGERGPTREVQESSEGRPAQVEYDDVGVVGIWTLSYRVAQSTGQVETVEEHFAVNPEPTEGQLLPAKYDDVRSGLPQELDLEISDSYGETSDQIAEAQQGEVTKYILYVLLAVMLLETWLAMRFGRRSMPATDAS